MCLLALTGHPNLSMLLSGPLAKKRRRPVRMRDLDVLEHLEPSEYFVRAAYRTPPQALGFAGFEHGLARKLARPETCAAARYAACTKCTRRLQYPKAWKHAFEWVAVCLSIIFQSVLKGTVTTIQRSVFLLVCLAAPPVVKGMLLSCLTLT